MRRITTAALPSPGSMISLSFPASMKIIHLAVNFNMPTMFYEVDEQEPHSMYFEMFCLGPVMTIPQGAEHIGSLTDPSGMLWHYYGRKS